MSKVGSFLFYWSTLEQALSQSLEGSSANARKGPVKGTFKERLERWGELAKSNTDPELVRLITSQALNLRETRNLIVHGLNAGNSMPKAGAPFIECAVGGYDSPTGEIVRYTMDELDELAQAADACRRGFAEPRNFSFHPSPGEAESRTG